MRIHNGIVIVLASGGMWFSACAQQAAPHEHFVSAPEVALSYDLVGSNAPAGQCGCFVLNGGSATAALPISAHRLSLAAQISATHAGGIGAPKYDLTLFSYMGGVRYTTPFRSGRARIFAQGLIGASHASGSLVGVPNPGAQNAGIALAGSIGGGLDVRWKRYVSVRAFEADYEPTTFSNNTTSLQNNYRVSAGIVFHP